MREHIGPDEALRCLLDLVCVVIHRDRLQQHHAVWCEQIRAALEEGAEVLPSHRLDHLDRHELVVAAAQIAIVVEQHLDAALDTGLAAPVRGPCRIAPSRSSWS